MIIRHVIIIIIMPNIIINLGHFEEYKTNRGENEKDWEVGKIY